MILIADSGATSTNWALLSESGVDKHVTPGMNPVTSPDEELKDSLLQLLQWRPLMPQRLFFYGAGCGTAAATQRMHTLLSQTFPLSDITIATDLMAACRAACGDAPGRVGILGTGSNACYYDGVRLWQPHPSLGYLMGDEGSGNHLGRLLLRDYLTKAMPEALSTMFHDTYHLEYTQIMQRLYRQPNANRFMAGFVPFLAQHQSEDYVYALLNEAFHAFLQEQIVPLQHPEAPLHLVGGVACEFRQRLMPLCQRAGVTVASIIKEPLGHLVQYHARQLQSGL